MKQFFLIFIMSSIPPFLIYWVGINTFDNYAAHLGYFSLFPVFSIHALVWGLLGGGGFIISSFVTKQSLNNKKFSFKHLAILGLLIGTSHFIAQFNIEYFLAMLPLPVLISWLCSSVCYKFIDKAG
ncbi:hypothetical protein [Shewanella youngdeokensis]|uniref:Uncharacterized protein n=1 Tax=Shewanella youngdeokensis TaxID=2999068 RepID=A0ABZ0JVW3_9GAMM|nr:hypothetical protein RGE70_13795 [Shewanella sp. DAU334]